MYDHKALNDMIYIPGIGFGTYKLTGEEGKQAILDALEVGYRLIDTAQMYKNEEQVGQAIQESGIARDQIFITSKLENSVRGYDATIQAVEQSLKKLQTDYVDLFLLHWPIPKDYKEDWQEMNNETWKALEKLVAEEKILAIGVSNFYPLHIEALEEYATIPPAVNQIRLTVGDCKEDLVKYCQDKGIVIEAYSPLGRGEAFENEELKAIAKKYNKSVAQVMLRWSIQKGFIPIPKSSHKQRMQENIDIYDFSLTEEEMLTLSAIKGYEEETSLHPEKINF